MKKIHFLRLTVLITLSFFTILSCERDDNPLGSSVLTQSEAQSKKLFIDVLTQTMTPEPIRSDRSRLDMLLGVTQTNDSKPIYSNKATVGVYNEPIFGKTISSFYSQVRLSKLYPDFGKNAKVDSVVLSLPSVAFSKDTIKTSDKVIETLYSTDNKDKCKLNKITEIHEKNFVIPIDSIYGNSSSKINLQVFQVTEDMGTIDDKLTSNKSFNISNLLGEKNISNQAEIRSWVSSEKIGDKTEKKIIFSENTPNYHIQLPGLVNLFQDKVIDQHDNTSDQVTFISNVLKGIKITTNSDNGFILTFAPDNTKITMYYSFDNPSFKDSNNNNVDDSEENCPNPIIKKRLTGTYLFSIGTDDNNNASSYNVYQNEIKNTGVNLSSTSKDKIYLSGMGGNTVRLDFDKRQIENLKESVKKYHWAITEAYIKVYIDKNQQGNLPIPNYLYLYNYTNKDILEDYLGQKTSGKEGLLFDKISEPYQQNYYLLRVTDFLKEIVEKDKPLTSLALSVGDYIKVDRGSYFYTPPAYDYSNNIYNPYRLVAFGGDNSISGDKRLRLEIHYTVQ